MKHIVQNYVDFISRIHKKKVSDMERRKNMENRECEFNLLDEPWIKVMRRDGTIDEVSF